MQGSLARLTETFAKSGEIRWIGVRPDRRVEMKVLEEVEIVLSGLAGDRRMQPGKRAVSLIQWEHLAVIPEFIEAQDIHPSQLRRNIAVSGINLLGLRKVRFQIGTAVLKGTGVCAPCSRMEETLGRGGYNAVRGHGGITAEVIEPGLVKLGDHVAPADP